jgi:hypothetical protein
MNAAAIAAFAGIAVAIVIGCLGYVQARTAAKLLQERTVEKELNKLSIAVGQMQTDVNWLKDCYHNPKRKVCRERSNA